MKRSTFLAISAIIAIFFGITMLLMPDKMLAMYAITMDGGGILVGRSLGALLFSLGLINWTARKAEDSLALRAILFGNLASHALTLVLDLMGTTSGDISAQGWGAVVMHLVLGAGFAYYAFAKPTNA